MCHICRPFTRIYSLTSSASVFFNPVCSETNLLCQGTILHIHSKILQKKTNTHSISVTLKETEQSIWTIPEGAFLWGTDLLDLSSLLSVIRSTLKQVCLRAKSCYWNETSENSVINGLILNHTLQFPLLKLTLYVCQAFVHCRYLKLLVVN